MAKLTEKQKEFLKKHNMWNPDKDKSKLGMFEGGDFKDFFRRKEKVEVELARLPDEQKKQELTQRLQAAEDKAKNKKFKEAYKDLEDVKNEARQEADNFVNSLSPAKLGQEVDIWKQQGQNVKNLVSQVVSGKKTAQDELLKLSKVGPFASGTDADKFLTGLDDTELLLHNQLDAVKDACGQVDSYLGKNDPVTKLQNFGHQLSVLRKEKNADVADLDLRVESARVLFLHAGKTLAVGEIRSGVDQLETDIDQTIDACKKQATLLAEQAYLQDFLGRKGKVEQELARLPDEAKKKDLTQQLQAAEGKAKNQQVKEAYQDLAQVELEAKQEADKYVNSLSPDKLDQEITAWHQEGETLGKLVTQAVAEKQTAQDELSNVGTASAFGSSVEADEFLRVLNKADVDLHSQVDAVKDACNKVDTILGQSSPAAKLQDFSHQLGLLQKEKNADVAELTKRVESAHKLFLHGGKPMAVGDIQSGVDQLVSEIDQTIEERKKAATVLANKVYWAERSITVGDQMLVVLKTGPVERSKIEALWAFANARAEKGGDADLAAAVMTLGDLKSLLDNSQPEVKGPVGGVEKTGEALAEARQLESAQVVLNTNTKAADAALKRLRLEFQPALPAALNLQALKLDGLIAPSTETDPEKVGTLAKSVAQETLKLDELAVAPRTERTAWKQDLAAFELQLATLADHPLKNNLTTVKPLIDKIKEDLEKAKLDATAMKWTDASAAVKLLVPRCAEAMETADGLAHFDTIRLERANRVAKLPNGVIAQEQARQAVASAKKLLTDADLEKNGGKYPAAILLLNQIPAAVDAALLLVKKAKAYATTLAKSEGYVTELGLFTDDAQVAIATGLEQFTQRVAAAKIDQTNDYVTSMTLLGQTDGQYKSLKAKAQQAKDYKEALAAFDVRLKAVEDHVGRIAIEEFFARIGNDRIFAEGRKLVGEFYIGTKILTESQPLHAAQIALADIAKNYKEKHKKAEEDILALGNETNAGQAAEGLAEAKRRVVVAENTATAKDWPGALKAIDQAAQSVADARKLLADDKRLANLKDTGKLDAIATDFDAAFGVYEAMRSHVAGKDTGRVFAAKLAAANAPAQSARDASGTLPPNLVLARSQLDAAIEICEKTMLLVTKKGQYDAALPPLKTAHTTTLPGINEDNCILTKIQEIGQAITSLENLAKAPTFNFDEAQQAIGAAMPKVRDAEANAKAFKAMKPNLQTVKAAITYMKLPARAAGVVDEIKRLTDAETSINNDVAAGKIPDAAKTAAAAATLCPGLKLVAEEYKKAVGYRQRSLDKIPDIEGGGKEACARELAEAKAALDEIDELFAAHIYINVLPAAKKVTSAVKAGKAILVAAQQYETARLLAETKLTNALPNRNAATEERYDALSESYDAAVELVKNERNYNRAKNMVTTIPVGCDGLTADAQAFRDYEASRKNAGTKLGEAMKDKQAEAARPLLTNLQGRHAAAVKIATGGDYAGAKKLLDAIFTEAEKALLAATDARNYNAAAEDIKKPGTGIDEALAKAEQMYKDLMAKPEALYAVATLGGINKTIEDAKKDKTTNEQAARTSLVQVVDACAKARILMGHYEQMDARMKALETEMKNLLASHAQKDFVKPAVEKLLEDIEGARREARGTGDYVKATKQIQTADTAFIAQRRAADAHIPYVARKGEVEIELAKMDKHISRYAIVGDIAAVREGLNVAATKAIAHDHKAAMELLAGAAETADDALLKAKMHLEAVAPTEAEVKKILEGKGGVQRLDAIIATLDPKAKRKVLDVAFAVRFGCKLKRFVNKADETSDTEDMDKEKKAPDIKRFYDLMSGLPETHTKDNDSMLVFHQLTERGGASSYAGGGKRVAMREGDVATSGAYDVALPQEIDEVEPGCEVDVGEQISFFNWNTLHEVGHAVDDKLGFMKSRGNGLAGWTVYGGNVRPVAVAVAGKFNFDVAYVASYMVKAASIAIPEPKGCDAEEWERRRVACIAWVDSARAGNAPWKTGSSAKALDIGGTVYQESYDDGRWSSYNLSARKQGVTGYQFRAPGEWFSELYAAYHTKKLKPSHPAYAWLQTL